MKILTIDHIPGQEYEVLGAVKGTVVYSKNLGADAIVGMRYGSAAVMQGAAEVIAYGTAVKLR